MQLLIRKQQLQLLTWKQKRCHHNPFDTDEYVTTKMSQTMPSDSKEIHGHCLALHQTPGRDAPLTITHSRSSSVSDSSQLPSAYTVTRRVGPILRTVYARTWLYRQQTDSETYVRLYPLVYISSLIKGVAMYDCTCIYIYTRIYFWDRLRRPYSQRHDMY